MTAAASASMAPASVVPVRGDVEGKDRDGGLAARPRWRRRSSRPAPGPRRSMPTRTRPPLPPWRLERWRPRCARAPRRISSAVMTCSRAHRHLPRGSVADDAGAARPTGRASAYRRREVVPGTRPSASSLSADTPEAARVEASSSSTASSGLMGFTGRPVPSSRPADLAQPRVDLPVPVERLADVLVQWRRVEHEVVGGAPRACRACG